jgi:hypothetical protein
LNLRRKSATSGDFGDVLTLAFQHSSALTCRRRA